MPMFLDLPVWYDDNGHQQTAMPFPASGTSGQFLQKGTGDTVGWATISTPPGWASHYITAAEPGASGWRVSFCLDVPYTLVPPEKATNVTAVQTLLYYMGFNSGEQTLPCSGWYDGHVVWGIYVDPSYSDGFCLCYDNQIEFWVDDCSVLNDMMVEFGTADV